MKTNTKKSNEFESKDTEPAPETNGGNTAVVRAQNSALVAHADNPWLEVATELDKYLGAPFLKFTKQGEFALADDDVIEDGTKAVARIDLVTLGWVRWWDGKRTDQKMGSVADKFVPPTRNELGENDPNDWEENDDGSPRDPWTFTMNLPVTVLDTSETFAFTTTSKGGLSAVHKLVRAYGNHIAKGKAGVPIIELKADSYKHPRFGKIFKPYLHIVNWTDASMQPLSTADDLNDEIPL